VSDFDTSQSLDSSTTPLTRDFIGLCIGILVVVLALLIVALCTWARCLYVKNNDHHDIHNEILSSVIQADVSTSHRYSRSRHHHHHERSSSCHRINNTNPHASSIRDGFLSPPVAQQPYYVCRANDSKGQRGTTKILAVQPCQQLVPRLSISPQESSSSIATSACSIKQ
jgi:hypothetical protein